MNRFYLILSLITIGLYPVFSQPSFQKLEHLLKAPKHYVACFTSEKIEVDGNISENEWNNAPWSESFEDIEGERKQAPLYKTRMKLMWDDHYLYVAAELEDPHVWSYLKEHDEVVFYDNDFEVFIDPDNNTHQYFEIEVNALNTIFDLFLPKPYRCGSGALISWDTPGLKSAVQVQGTLNNPKDTDRGWTVEMAIPFAAITIGNVPNIPKEGNLWRINFSRVEWQTEIAGTEYVKKKDPAGKVLPEDNWVWSPQGVINMHCPERWGYLLFTRKENWKEAPEFHLPYQEKQKKFLWMVYYLQQEYREKNGHYALSLQKLGVDELDFLIENHKNMLQMEASENQFVVFIQQKEGSQAVSLNQEGLVQSRVK